MTFYRDIVVMRKYIWLVSFYEYMANYLGDNNKQQVHDLENQKENCQMDEIKIVHRRYFIPDTFEQANTEGYTSCIHCIGNLQ